MAAGRPGPAALECAIDVWGKSRPGRAACRRCRRASPAIDEDAVRAAAKRLGAAKKPLIVCRRRRAGRLGRSDRSSRDAAGAGARPIGAAAACSTAAIRSSVTLPLGHELWGEADVGARQSAPGCYIQFQQWGVDDDLAIIRVDADPEEPARLRKPAVALVGDAQPILRRLHRRLPAHNAQRAVAQRRDAGAAGAHGASASPSSAPQLGFLDAIRAELPEDGILVDEVTQMGFAARLAFPVYKPRTFLSPGYQDNLGWGFATALGAQDARPRRAGACRSPATAASCSPRTRWRPRCATAFRCRRSCSPTAPSATCAASRRSVRQPADRQRPRQSGFRAFAESFGAAAERARSPEELRAALAARLRAPRRPDPDRGAGRADALALGVHPHAARCAEPVTCATPGH